LAAGENLYLAGRMDKQLSLWEQVIDPENIWRAYLAAKKGKSRRPDVAKFSLRLEMELFDLRQSLMDGSYRPAGYRQFTVYERKPRLISSAPFRDRVLHHALMQVVEPIFEGYFSPNSWASRKNKGTHQAVQQYQNWSKRYAYALKMDIAGYFHNIGHARLLEKIAFVIDDVHVMHLFSLIVESAGNNSDKGLPIGNLTSQVMANVYLNRLDRFITDFLGFHAYLRYVDDMVILSDNKTELWNALSAIEHQLSLEGLYLNPRKVYLTPTRCGLDFLGYRVYPRFKQLRHDNAYRFQRKLKKRIRAYQTGQISWQDLDASVQSWLGHAKQADTWGLRKSIFSGIVISRGVSEHAVGSRRWLEQQTEEPALRQPEQEQRQ